MTAKPEQHLEIWRQKFKIGLGYSKMQKFHCIERVICNNFGN